MRLNMIEWESVVVAETSDTTVNASQRAMINTDDTVISGIGDFVSVCIGLSAL